MKSFRDFSIQEQASDLVSRTYNIEASPNVIRNFERFLAHVQYCSSVGHSTGVAMSVDGDGADRFKVISPDVKDQHPGEKAIKSYDSGRFEMVPYSD